MALAEVFEQVAGPDAPVRFRAYDGSSTGAADSPVTITVRSPVAVAYLAQAPGGMGLASARGEFVVLLNNDTVVTEHWLEQLTALAAMSPALGMVAPMEGHARQRADPDRAVL